MAATKTSSKSSKDSTSSKKSTAKGSTKTTSEPRTQVGKEIDEVREKRAAMDQPVVDTPLAATDSHGETLGLGDKGCIDVQSEGSTITLTLEGKSIVLDREGALSLQRHLDQATAGL